MFILFTRCFHLQNIPLYVQYTYIIWSRDIYFSYYTSIHIKHVWCNFITQRQNKRTSVIKNHFIAKARQLVFALLLTYTLEGGELFYLMVQHHMAQYNSHHMDTLFSTLSICMCNNTLGFCDDHFPLNCAIQTCWRTCIFT